MVGRREGEAVVGSGLIEADLARVGGKEVCFDGEEPRDRVALLRF
jgi:hypothetical protein